MKNCHAAYLHSADKILHSSLLKLLIKYEMDTKKWT